eukprot:12509467-Alexandrium_andersonii.AAC.1
MGGGGRLGLGHPLLRLVSRLARNGAGGEHARGAPCSVGHHGKGDVANGRLTRRDDGERDSLGPDLADQPGHRPVAGA